MTELTKPIRRTTTLLLDRRLQARQKDRIVVSLYPDQTIGFRQRKCQREYRLPLIACYKLAILEHTKEDKRQKQIRSKISRGLLTTERR